MALIETVGRYSPSEPLCLHSSGHQVRDGEGDGEYDLGGS